ncbi:MAG: DUF1993 family protein [Haliangiales bacterium]
MSLSLYDITVPPLVSSLGSLKVVVDKGAAHVEAKELDPRALLDARLYPDMFPFLRQIQVVSDVSRRGLDRLAGKEPSSTPDDETSFAELGARITATIEHIKGADRAAIDAAEDREIKIDLGQPMTFTGRRYVQTFMMPNIMFHLTTAYNILRHNGVELGKRDYLTPFVAGA